jgi:sulfite exporter TauE/SafE
MSISKEVAVKANVGTVDRIIRFVIGIVIIVVGIYFKNWWGLVGLIPIISAAIRWCPIYRIFGIATCQREPAQ